MTIGDCAEIRDLIVDGEWVDSANLALEKSSQKTKVQNRAQALTILRSLLQSLLDADLYLHAATLLWGRDMFSAEPESVRRSFDAMNKGSKVLYPGASSMGKTFSVGAYMLLDYLRDPLYTTVKLASTNEDHLRKNLFAHVATLFRACSIPHHQKIEIRDSDLWMGVKEAGFEFGISGIAFKQSQETSGQFKGYKVKPVRAVRHPKYGFMTRLRVLGDEASNWPGGPFQDFNSLIASMGSNVGLIKIALAFNPEFLAQHAVQLAEPEGGYSVDQLDTLYDYVSKSGWLVCRLDAAKCENVIQRKEIYPGLQTYDGFMSYLKSGGDTSSAYFTFARGFPPLTGSVNTIIPPSWPQMARGEAIFIETPENVAAVDLAYMGQDTAQMSVGRWGKASGWRDEKGVVRKYKDRLNVARDKPRHVLQVDQLIELQKVDDTVIMAEEIMGKAEMLGIKPEHVALDRTSIGLGTYSHLRKVWGDVVGIAWNEGATGMKILAEDRDPASVQCDGIMSEMWWAFRRWLDPRVGAVLLNPIVPQNPLFTQLTSRRYKTGKKGIKVESKEEYKARNQKSPDESDSIIMLEMLVRKAFPVIPGLVEQDEPRKKNEWKSSSNAADMVDLEAETDTDDSIAPDPQ